MAQSAAYRSNTALTGQFSLLQVTAMSKSAVIRHAIVKKCRLNATIDTDSL